MEKSISNSNFTMKTAQIQVRTGLRSGNYLDKCQRELEDLQRTYQKLVAEARRMGLSV